jgi:hypothetical protein
MHVLTTAWPADRYALAATIEDARANPGNPTLLTEDESEEMLGEGGWG